MSEPSARLFVAAWLPPFVVDLLAALPRADDPRVRWTRPEQWHVTLRFLGGVPAPAVPAAHAALDAVQARPVEVTLGPRPGRLGRNVFIVPVQGFEPVAAAVNAAFEPVFGPGEARAFHGHVTLARLQGRPACALTDDVVVARWTADRIALVQSHLGRGGARYETIAWKELR